MNADNVKAVLVDKDRTRILEMMDREGDYVLCYFYYSKRALWLSKDELKALSDEMYKDKKGKANGNGPEQPL